MGLAGEDEKRGVSLQPERWGWHRNGVFRRKRMEMAGEMDGRGGNAICFTNSNTKEEE